MKTYENTIQYKINKRTFPYYLKKKTKNIPINKKQYLKKYNLLLRKKTT